VQVAEGEASHGSRGYLPRVPAVIRPLAAAAAAVLFLTLFLPWYGGSVEEAVRPADVPDGRYSAVSTTIENGSGWSYLGLADILVALAAVAVIVLVLRGSDRRALLAGAAVALATAALIAFRVVFPPPPPFSVGALDLGVPAAADTPEVTTQRTGPERRYGVFVAFAAAMTAAGAAGLAARRHPGRD
jgi:hypothetical protein